MLEKEYISKDYALYLVNYFGNMLTWSKDDIISEIKRKITEEPAVDVSPVVRCKECVLHGHCSTEDVFLFSRIKAENAFCCVGKRKENENA